MALAGSRSNLIHLWNVFLVDDDSATSDASGRIISRLLLCYESFALLRIFTLISIIIISSVSRLSLEMAGNSLWPSIASAAWSRSLQQRLAARDTPPLISSRVCHALHCTTVPINRSIDRAIVPLYQKLRFQAMRIECVFIAAKNQSLLIE